jgi:ribonuclease D
MMLCENTFAPTVTNDELAALPPCAFAGRIVVVEDEATLTAACDHLATQPAVGFDTETRPSFKAGVVHRVALLQLSTADVCYLVRLNKLALERPLARLFENPHVLKVGAALSNDIPALRKMRQFRQAGFVDLQSIVSQWGITDLSVRKMAAIVLGVRVSKAQRLSNWEAATLTAPQQLYAATDAWVCLEIYNRLHKTNKKATR